MKLAAGIALLTTAAIAASDPVPVKVSVRNETTPAATTEYFAWGKSRRGRPNTYDVWAQRGTEAPFKVNARNTTGWPGGIDGTRLVYQQVRSGFVSDIRFFDLATRRQLAAPRNVNTDAWEWAPTISGDWLLFGRGAVLKNALQQVILQNLVTSEKIVLDSMRSTSGSLQAGQLNGTYAVWGRCANRAANCRVYRYDLATRTKTRIAETAYNLFAPSVTASGATYYGRSTSRFCGSDVELVKTTLDGTTVVLYVFPPGADFTTSYALQIPGRPPTGLETTRVYYDRVTCSPPSRFDVYSIDDVVQAPPPPPP